MFKFLFKYNKKLKFNTGNDNYYELFIDALLHPSKVIIFLLAPVWKFILLINGVKYGKNVITYGKPRIENRGEIRLGNNVRLISVSNAYTSGNLNRRTYLRTSKTGKIYIGNNVYLNGTAIISDVKVKLENRIMIGANTIILDTNTHNIPYKDRLFRWDKVKKEPVIIEDGVWIGSNCMIMKGVIVGKGSVIAAGSIVVNDVKPYSIYGGNPAKFIKLIETE